MIKEALKKANISEAAEVELEVMARCFNAEIIGERFLMLSEPNQSAVPTWNFVMPLFGSPFPSMEEVKMIKSTFATRNIAGWYRVSANLPGAAPIFQSTHFAPLSDARRAVQKNPPQVRIRPAFSLDEFMSIAASGFELSSDIASTLKEKLTPDFQQSADYFLIAEYSGRPVGTTCLLLTESRDAGIVFNGTVLKEFRNRGIYRALSDYLITHFSVPIYRYTSSKELVTSVMPQQGYRQLDTTNYYSMSHEAFN